MKRILYLLMAVAVLASCSKHEDLDTLPNEKFTISVTDGGYTASDKSSVAQTRATENGYTTEFTAGDKIGLYVVKPDGSYVHENVALTLTNNGSGTLSWQAPTGTTLYYEGAAAKYYAYYPYSNLLEDQTPPTAAGTTLTNFFAGLITAWNPAPDQSTYASYTDQDLMVGSGTVSKQADAYTLALTMVHAMALVVIETPMTKYTFSNSSPAIPDYYIPAPDTKFYGFTPYNPTVGTYRLLVKPSQSGATDLMGSYTAENGTTKEYTIVQNSINAANYAHYRVDGGTTTTINKTHNLQVGDFYMSDGSLLGKDAALTNAQKATCLGIVLKVGKDDDSDWKDDCEYKFKDGTTPMPTIHGYVLALYDANGSNYCKWGSTGTNVGTNTEFNTGFYGYTNTNKIKQYAKANSKTLVSDFPATYHATEGYNLSHQAPATTSGWFLPSAGQCQYWLNSSTVLLASIKKAISNDNYQWKSWYWSSSENSNYPEYGAWYLEFYSKVMNGGGKDDNGFVRSALAF